MVTSGGSHYLNEYHAFCPQKISEANTCKVKVYIPLFAIALSSDAQISPEEIRVTVYQGRRQL